MAKVKQVLQSSNQLSNLRLSDMRSRFWKEHLYFYSLRMLQHMGFMGFRHTWHPANNLSYIFKIRMVMVNKRASFPLKGVGEMKVTITTQRSSRTTALE